MTKPEKATQLMEKIAADQSHGYSQQNRWGPDYDCSSLTIEAYECAGVPVKSNGASYTGNMYGVFTKCGFKDVTKKCNLSTGNGMLRGDVLMYHRQGNVGHVAVYCGNGKVVHARGQSYGSSKTGDQGTEIAVTAYYNPGWQYVLRYTGSEVATTTPTTPTTPTTAPTTTGKVGTCSVTLGQFIEGSQDPEIKTIQIILNARGYRGKDGKVLDVDGELGPNTAYAITSLQKAGGMKNINFGTVAAATWKLILQ